MNYVLKRVWKGISHVLVLIVAMVIMWLIALGPAVFEMTGLYWIHFTLGLALLVWELGKQ